MNELLQTAEAPELVFGLIAPIGVDLDKVTDLLSDALKEMGYDSPLFKVTSLMTEANVDLPLVSGRSIAAYKSRIAYANAVRARLGDHALAAFAVSAIRTFRADAWRRKDPQKFYDDASLLTKAEETPLPATAYIIRQLKRPEEVVILRRVYGRQFVLISAYAPEDQRRESLVAIEHAATDVDPGAALDAAAELIAQDSNETQDDHGQNVRDAFHLADAFIDARTVEGMKRTIDRFISLLFGHNQITPSRDEYGMYMAKSASLRSSDLSRQVGAAIFRQSGEVVTLGCNEVPRAGGGTYWEEDPNDARDFKYGFDPNERQKHAVLTDIFVRLREAKCLSPELLLIEDDVELTKAVLGHPELTEARAKDLIEFGRIIHAEMSAIGDAARNGLSVRDATLFCTTFPCHLCASNIVAAGIKRVVYVEPYPKSYAKLLHEDSICLESPPVGAGDRHSRVLFEPFVGVSPFRYRDLFEKGKRKYSGVAQEWEGGRPRPCIDVYFPSYFEAENIIAADLRAQLVPLVLPAPDAPAQK